MKTKKKTDRKTFSFFIIMFPALIMALIGIIGDKTFFNAILQIAFLLFQSVLLKQFIETYYEIF